MSRWLEKNAQWVGKGFFTGNLYDLGEYPAAVFDPNIPRKVFGEIWKLINYEQTIAKIDHYEGTNDSPPEYVRQLISITTSNHQTLPCWVYLCVQSPENRPLILHGSYRRWIEE